MNINILWTYVLCLQQHVHGFEEVEDFPLNQWIDFNIQIIILVEFLQQKGVLQIVGISIPNKMEL